MEDHGCIPIIIENNTMWASGMRLILHKQFELSEVTLSFVEWCIHFGNGTCHLQIFIPQNPPFASPNIAGLSVIHSGYCHPPSPDIIPLQTYTQNLHSVPSYPTKGLPTMKLQRCQKHMSKREWGLFSKKC